MSDGHSYVPLSKRANVPKPGDLLTDENVEKILATIPNPVYRSFLERHMMESERAAYCLGVAAGSKGSSPFDAKTQSMLAAAGVTDGTRMFEIWAEGFSIQGSRGRASKIGVATGKNFKEACAAAHVQGLFEGHGNFDPVALSVWGCRLFDNEAEARKGFG